MVFGICPSVGPHLKHSVNTVIAGLFQTRDTRSQSTRATRAVQEQMPMCTSYFSAKMATQEKKSLTTRKTILKGKSKASTFWLYECCHFFSRLNPGVLIIS